MFASHKDFFGMAEYSKAEGVVFIILFGIASLRTRVVFQRTNSS